MLWGPSGFTRAFRHNFSCFSNSVWRETRFLSCDFTNIGMCKNRNLCLSSVFQHLTSALPSAFYFLYPFIKRSFLWIKFISCTGGDHGTETMHTHNTNIHTPAKSLRPQLCVTETQMRANAGWALEGNKAAQNNKRAWIKKECKQSPFIARLSFLMELPTDSRFKTWSFLSATITQNTAKDVQLN